MTLTLMYFRFLNAQPLYSFYSSGDWLNLYNISVIGDIGIVSTDIETLVIAAETEETLTLVAAARSVSVANNLQIIFN